MAQLLMHLGGGAGAINDNHQLFQVTARKTEPGSRPELKLLLVGIEGRDRPFAGLTAKQLQDGFLLV